MFPSSLKKRCKPILDTQYPLQIFAIQHHHGKAQRAQPFVLAQLVGAWWFAGCFTFNENETAAG